MNFFFYELVFLKAENYHQVVNQTLSQDCPLLPVLFSVLPLSASSPTPLPFLTSLPLLPHDVILLLPIPS